MPTWALHVDGDLDEVNRHWARLATAGVIGAAEVDGHATVYFADKPPEAPLAGRWERVPDRDWHRLWRAGLTPVQAGRWTVSPPWLATGAIDELVIDPGQAFGTGQHETTRRCLEALDEAAPSDRTVLDCGTGSGVLAIAAARAGAQVTAIDIDPLATAAARHNARRNRVAIDIRLGGFEVIAGARFDIVVANLDTATLIACADAISDALSLDGHLIASGVANERADQVCSALARSGLRVDRDAGVEWSLLRGGRAAAAGPGPAEAP